MLEMFIKISLKRCRANNEIMNSICQMTQQGILELKRLKVLLVYQFIFVRLNRSSCIIERINPLAMSKLISDLNNNPKLS